ncbi:MAG: SAM-dependent methyltransferase [Porphyromonadaceae bacterium CG2_30_38_12]|nr:MAG: SAM-dependent methyltransferase [Porphyromonadaceae bacterium CG2_30_38_12]
MHTEIRFTNDGSHTLYVPEIDESYHSVHGAIQESQHIFIQAALEQCTKNEIRVLEIGFGTGLNALLALVAASKNGKSIHYTGIEKFPVDASQAEQLNYSQNFDATTQTLFRTMLQAAWNVAVPITPWFTLFKIETDFVSTSFIEHYDVVFFDAFSPDKQPEMWTAEQFGKLYNACNENAILSTYCAKGIVRRTMQACGFSVERLSGPPGKREILRALKI